MMQNHTPRVYKYRGNTYMHIQNNMCDMVLEFDIEDKKYICDYYCNSYWLTDCFACVFVSDT